MPTLFNRLFAFCANNHKVLPNETFRKQLGSVVIKAYQESRINKPIHRVKTNELGKSYSVINYPIEFKSKLDYLIEQGCIDLPNIKHKLTPDYLLNEGWANNGFDVFEKLWERIKMTTTKTGKFMFKRIPDEVLLRFQEDLQQPILITNVNA